MQIARLPPDRLDEIVALVLRCDETWRPWAPLGWNPPPAARERASWRERLEGDRHWVRGALDDDGRLIGIAAWRLARERGRGGPEIPEVGQLGMLFVDPSAWGRGVGRDLLGASEEAMREAGCNRGLLNVAERNPARAFYERHGWTAAGPPEYSPGLDLPLVSYKKRL